VTLRCCLNLGSPQEQGPPVASYDRLDQERVETETDGRKTTRTENRRSTVQLPIDASRINADLNLDYRRKGLLWYSTYVVDFEGKYTFRNPTDNPQFITFRLKFPAEHAIYDGLVMEVNRRPLPIILNQLGLNQDALSYLHQGRKERLTEIQGNVINQIV
jgi:hypothetical protein